MERSLILNNKLELRRFLPQDIVYIKAEGNYVNIHTTYKQNISFTMQLGKVGEAIGEQLKQEASDFIIVGRSYIVNRNYIVHIIPKDKLLMLHDHRGTVYKLDDIHPTALHRLMECILEEARKEEART